MKLAALIEWRNFDVEWVEFFSSHRGRQATSTAACSVAALPAAHLPAVRRGCGRALGGRPGLPTFLRRDVFQHRIPLDFTSLTRGRKRIVEESLKQLLAKKTEAGGESRVISERGGEAVIVDSMVMEKAVAL